MKHSKSEHLVTRKAAATPRCTGVTARLFAARAAGAALWDATVPAARAAR